MLNILRRPVNSIQSIQRKKLESDIATKKETLDNLRVLVEDMKEIKGLQQTDNQLSQEIEALTAEIAGLNNNPTKKETK